MATNHPPPRQVPPPERREGDRRESSYARFIPREEMPAKFEAWTPGVLDGPPIARPPISAPAPPPPPAAVKPVEPPPPNLEQVAQAARQSGYQDGYRDGLVALEAFKQSFSQQMSGQIGMLVQSFDTDMRSLEDQMAETLVRCAVELARQVVRSELQARPELIARVAHDAVEALQLSARHVRVRVHPDDYPLVQTGAGEEMRARGAQVIPDDSIMRGGCTVESDLGSVDATLPARWQHAAAAMGQVSVWEDRRGAATPEPDEGAKP
ncbi:MAG TPA: FliH/SctL family protein [Burkholderiaceae bacterium]|jgi:flagellar assembly protein FliH